MADAAAASDLTQVGLFLRELASLCRRYKFGIYANMRSIPYDPDGVDLGGLVIRDKHHQELLRGWVVWSEGAARSDLVGGPVYATVDAIDTKAIATWADDALEEAGRPEVQAVRESLANLREAATTHALYAGAASPDVVAVHRAHDEAEPPATSLDQIGPMIEKLGKTLHSFDDESGKLSERVRRMEERLVQMWRIEIWVVDKSVLWALGWAKIGKNWRIVIEENSRSTGKRRIRAFCETPRLMRLEAAPLLPKLVETMNSRATARLAASAGVPKGEEADVGDTLIRHLIHATKPTLTVCDESIAAMQEIGESSVAEYDDSTCYRCRKIERPPEEQR